MAKKPCVVCGTELGMLSMKIAISDGLVCMNCLARAGVATLGNPAYYNTNSIRELIARRMPLINSFNATKSVGAYIRIDENNKTFVIGSDLFEYSNLLDFELLEDGESITKGGLGRAVAGGLLFGGVGAVVGGVTGGKKTKGVCTSMKIRLTLRNAHTDTAYINLITASTKTKGIIYKTAQSTAQQCISALQIIADINQTACTSADSAPNVSAADEIIKFKQLMDAGVISQQEFEAKKRQLLGL